jgi:tetratricopeptide (TPR) repeat protein
MGNESTEEFHTLTLDMFYYRAIGNKDKYFEFMTLHTDKFLLENSDELVKRIFDIIQNYTSKKELEKAAMWAQKMLKNNNNSLSNYAYATVLFRQGNKPESLKYLDIASTKNDNPELDQYIQALKQELAK